MESRPSTPIRTHDLVQDLHAMMEALFQRYQETQRLGIKPSTSDLLTLYELAIRLDLLIESSETR